MIKAIQCQKLPIDTLQYNKKVFNSNLEPETKGTLGEKIPSEHNPANTFCK